MQRGSDSEYPGRDHVDGFHSHGRSLVSHCSLPSGRLLRPHQPRISLRPPRSQAAGERLTVPNLQPRHCQYQRIEHNSRFRQRERICLQVIRNHRLNKPAPTGIISYPLTSNL